MVANRTNTILKTRMLGKRLLLITSLIIATSIHLAIAAGCYAAISGVYEANEASIKKEEMEKARLAADPITTENIYNRFNAARANANVSTLTNTQNLRVAAEQLCSDMVANNYFDYKNPVSGKDANSFITDNANGLHYNWYVSSITDIPDNQTATEVIDHAFEYQKNNLTDNKYNSVGLALCQPTPNSTSKYMVAMLADVGSPQGTGGSGSNSNQNFNSSWRLPDVSVSPNAGGTIDLYSPPSTSSPSPTPTPTPPQKTYEQAASYCSGHGVPYHSSAWQQCISAYLR